MRIEVQVEANALFKVFWADTGQNFSEKRSNRVYLSQGDSKYKLYLTDLKNIKRLRIDPLNGPSKIVIKKIVIRQAGYKSIRFESIDEFKQSRSIYDIQNMIQVKNTPPWKT